MIQRENQKENNGECMQTLLVLKKKIIVYGRAHIVGLPIWVVCQGQNHI